MAKRICRTADRFDPTGVPLPRCCVRRATPPSCTAVVHEISQRDKDAFIFGEGCAGLARRQTGRDHSLTETALLPAPFWCTYAWNRPTSTGAGGSDPLWLCWRGKPWLAIRWRGYAAFKWSQLERQFNFRPAAITQIAQLCPLPARAQQICAFP